MRRQDRNAVAQQLKASLAGYQQQRRLPGIRGVRATESLVQQIIDSIRRVEFFEMIRSRPICPSRSDPNDPIFDPHRAAMLSLADGDIDEAFWLVFLSVHFGKNRRSGWQLTRDVYGRLGGQPWTWDRVSRSPTRFRTWLGRAQGTMEADGVSRGFGNHRKYQSLDAQKPTGTGAAVQSYVEWIGRGRSHTSLLIEAATAVGNDPKEMFHHLYESMRRVVSFGRTARFDYLTMLRNVGLVDIEPDSAYLREATGPVAGAALLFRGNANAEGAKWQLDEWLVELGSHTGLSMDVLEDALCNWQKNPASFVPFRG